LRRGLPGLQALAERGTPEIRASALIEIAFIQRVSNDFGRAAESYTRAASIAAPLGSSDILFDAWMGAARAMGSTRNHGAAAEALERAIAAAGAHPTRKQHFDVALYSAELAAERGEIESSLVSALDALHWAPAADDRFYAELDAASALETLAESCDYRLLHDSRSDNDPPDDPWGACKRTLAASTAGYLRAAQTANALGWRSLVAQLQDANVRVKARRQLLDGRAHGLPDPRANPQLSADFVKFTPRSRKDVLVERGEMARKYLAASVTGPSLNQQLLGLMEHTITNAVEAQGAEDPSALIMRGDLENARTGNTARATDLFARASQLLMKERASFFDPRRRGTVVERQGGLLAKLALTLLSQRRDDDAFSVFELGRARGLGELGEILGRKDVSLSDRAWLAQQVKLDAQTSAAEQRVVETVIGEGSLERPAEELGRWEATGGERRLHLLQRADLRDRFARSSFAPARLEELQHAATASGIPVLLYWVDNPNVYTWYVGPHGSDFAIIFLPAAALKPKIEQVRAIADESGSLNEAAARQLYLYLIAPFSDVLDAQQLLIVPQGELVGLPFEVLKDPDSDRFLIEQHIISYAPNASAALRSLQRTLPAVRAVTAIVDLEIDDGTHETSRIRAISGLQLRVLSADDVVPGKLVQSLRGAQAVHILLHGQFNALEPLLSTLGATVKGTPSLEAADLLAIPLRGTRLVVMSACESGELQRRVSNEIYGFPWVLLAAGAENVVTSRWRVNGASNGEWMKSFYAAVASGAPPAAAAAGAMRTMLKASHTSPYFWAAMQVTGR
ncbi:MAG TPA: CHAT domain-containing protein, partial [Steroidobacteraceae bacterium]|nr:CHAT domain-containing protein [Steroidobacteraceae bacterium]